MWRLRIHGCILSFRWKSIKLVGGFSQFSFTPSISTSQIPSHYSCFFFVRFLLFVTLQKKSTVPAAAAFTSSQSCLHYNYPVSFPLCAFLLRLPLSSPRTHLLVPRCHRALRNPLHVRSPPKPSCGFKPLPMLTRVGRNFLPGFGTGFRSWGRRYTNYEGSQPSRLPSEIVLPSVSFFSHHMRFINFTYRNH